MPEREGVGQSLAVNCQDGALIMTKIEMMLFNLFHFNPDAGCL
ncbi:Uncharacterized protein ChrSV_4339 [Chromobacterium vaccinii]|nr:Uncharacterized protein ChrSW_4339 [Chromobacterium vaccinii]QND91796.1 Uncharacterized protein ChrSV_4339 [Chromobacterium vaccinii]